MSQTPILSIMADLKWYGPAATPITNLSSVLNGNGTFNFIFNTSQASISQYGTYNWCNMPHVRPEEYEIPSSDYKLQYVEVIHRHHKRTPYASNAFPVEPYPWDCPDAGLFYYGQPRPETPSSNHSVHTYWDVYASHTNPFFAGGFNGSCSFPQITKEGLDDSWQHGHDLAGVYGSLLGFLPATYSNTTTAFRVTNNVITSQVAGMLIDGMFGPQTSADNIPLLIQPPTTDSLEPTYPCPAADDLAAKIRNTTVGSEWAEHLTRSAALFAKLDRISGVSPDDPDWHESFDHYFDNLSARLCHQNPLPCNSSLPEGEQQCISQAQADAIFRAGEYEYAYTWRVNPLSLPAAAAGYGVWMAELAGNIHAAMEGTSEVRYRHNIAHDGSVSPLLAILQVDEMVWPGMGAEVVFEIWVKEDKGSLRVLWGGKVLKSSNPSLGVMDMVPLETFLEYVDGLVGKEGSKVVELCKANEGGS